MYKHKKSKKEVTGDSRPESEASSGRLSQVSQASQVRDETAQKAASSSHNPSSATALEQNVSQTPTISKESELTGDKKAGNPKGKGMEKKQAIPTSTKAETSVKQKEPLISSGDKKSVKAQQAKGSSSSMKITADNGKQSQPVQQSVKILKPQPAPADDGNKVPKPPPLPGADSGANAAPPPPPPQPPPSLLEKALLNRTDEEPSPLVKSVLAKPVGDYAKKIRFDPNELLNKKRLLKRVDRKADYNPVTLARKELYEEEYLKSGDEPPEHLPLNYVKPTIVSHNIAADLTTLNMTGLDQLTDYLFAILRGGGNAPNAVFSNLIKLLIAGCINVTDQGLIWVSSLFPNVQMIELNACRKVTEKGLHYLSTHCQRLQNLQVMATGVSLIPDTIKNEPDGYIPPLRKKLLILRDSSLKDGVLPQLINREEKKQGSLTYHRALTVPATDSSQPPYSFNVFETLADNPLQDSLMSDGTIVMIPYCTTSDKSQLTKTANRVVETICSVIVKSQDVVFLLVEVNDGSVTSDAQHLIKSRLQYLVNSLNSATHNLYTRTWHLECLDFKGQQCLSYGLASLECLEKLLIPDEKRMLTLSVTKQSLKENVLSALSQCADWITENVPWVHCEWTDALTFIIEKIPKTAVTTQSTLFHQTDKEAREQKHVRYSYPRLGKVLNLLQNWGEGLYSWNQRKTLCVTDISAYEKLLAKLLSSKPVDKVSVHFLGGEVPCWTQESLDSVLRTEGINASVQDAISLLKRQGLILAVAGHFIDDEHQNQQVYVNMADVPENHDILPTLWPEPCPQQRILQNDRVYTFLPSLPPSFMPKLLRTILKVYQPLYIWKSGFFIRQGPVDIKAQIYKCKGSDTFHDTTALVLSARVVDLHLQSRVSAVSDLSQSAQHARSVMFAALRQVMSALDYVCQKVKVYSCITLPCPECAEFSTEGIINLDKAWHIPYYIALASRHRHCKRHKNVNVAFMGNMAEEDGEGVVMPLHNIPYHQANADLIDKAIRAKRHRPMDPTERCFYCGGAVDVPCLHCVMCTNCTKQFAKFVKFIQPAQVTSKSFKLQLMRSGKLVDDERIVSNTRGCVYFYKKGHRMQLLPAMTPYYWDEIFITILRGANVILQMTFGPGRTLEYHGFSGTIVNQFGEASQNDMWKSRDANNLNIRLESAEVGKRVRIVIFIKGLEVHREEIEGWNMKMDINSEKAGVYIIHTPGMKNAWLVNKCTFDVGSALEVTSDENTTHEAVILEKTPEGYLRLDINGVQKQFIYTSPQLRPLGAAVAMGSTLASRLSSGSMSSDGKSDTPTPVPSWAFLSFQVPCGYETLVRSNLSRDTQLNSEQQQTQKVKDLAKLILPCTTMDFPSVLHAKQVCVRDEVETMVYTDGKWNFPMTAMLMLPKSLTNNDFTACSQNMFSDGFKLHPMCCFRGDVNTVLTSPPTASQTELLECFHIVHMVDNAGFEVENLGLGQTEEKKEEKSTTGLSLLWAWTLLLLRLQHENLLEVKELTKNIKNFEQLALQQIHTGFKKIIQAVNQALFLSMGKDFDFPSTITDQAVERWRELMMIHGENQGLMKLKLAFLEENLLVCESHQATWQVSQNLTHFPGLPGMYGQFVYSISLIGNSLTELPGEVVASMCNLKDLGLTCNQLESLPDEIGLCTKLVTLSLGENNLKDLPSTLEKCQDILRLDIDKNDFAELPPVVTKLKALIRLYAQYLHLRSLPENIGDLSNLQTLVLGGNCLTSLPDSMRNLQQLKKLTLNGTVWMKVRSNILLSKDHFEEFLKTNNLHRWLDRHNQDKVSIFRLFDEDTNGTLDPKEMGKLNATMFQVLPRFGYKGRDQPDDDTPSGFPEILFELKALEYLSLQYQGIVSVPDGIKKLTNLQALHMGNNPNLLTVSAQLGSLPLKRLELEGCPRLKTPPKEIRAKGFITTFAYLKRLLSGSVSCKRTKLMLVGLGGAGKTSLVKTLLSGNKRVKLTVGEEITDGIDICPWTVPTEEGDIVYSVWDFAGQTVYYNTHQFFLSDRAVYLLMWNIRLGHEHAGLYFWLSSISVHAPKAPIFVVGTHLDQVSKVELPMREMQKKYPQICGFHFVSSQSGQGVQELQEQLVEVTLRQQYMGEKIPGVWLNFEDSIKSIQDKSVIEYRELENLANRSGVFDATEIVQAVQFLHELGSLQHFTNANLKSHVIINPQWIVDVMACVVSVKDSHIKDGRLNHADVAKVWKDYDPALHDWMLKLTEEFDLTFPLKGEQVNLVPCLLPERQPEFEWPEPDKNDYNKETKISYKFDYLPAGLFNRGQVRLHQFSDSALIWKRGSYLKKNGHICLIYQSKDSELTVKAHGPRPDNIVFLVHEVFETLILESFQGITYDFFLPCPDCLKLVVKDPHMFAASVVRRATELKAPFLQCLKYFHTISITDLHAVMPPDSNQDFDLHLVQAVRGMKELQQDLLADVFVSYCKADTVAKHEEAVVPSTVVDDVEKQLQYKCWVPGHKNASATDEMAKALLDAKVFMVFMSNNYIQDETCCNLFKYARLTLRKPVILVAIGDNLNWKQSNMGILMADEVFVNMMKASRYNHKFEELEAMLKDRSGIKKELKKKSFPPCFISYCWQNSAQAVAKGSRTTDGAVGYGDPRAIKDFLESKGIKCWIDVERVGIHGLFEDIGEGLIHARVMVVCISDQYAASDNCVMEFRYAANTLKLPIILAVVGTGNRWRASELGIISLNYPLVSFQERSANAMEKLLELVRSHIPSDDQGKTDKEGQARAVKENINKSMEEQQRLSFQELCELAQRKFLRQISQYVDQLDSTPYPNIMLVDFYVEEEKGQSEKPEKKAALKESEDSEAEGKSKSQNNVDKVTTIMSSGSGDFHNQKFCVHLLCEHEEGWHTSSDPIVLDVNFGRVIEQYLPYIARITAIAKYSKKIALQCLASDVGHSYVKWLEENPNVTVNTDFHESYGSLRQMVQDADTANSMGKLERCILPSGKFIWLCETHRKAMRVTVLARESRVTTVHHQSESIGVDYMLQALEDLDLDFLPQQLKDAQLTAKSAGKRKKSPKISESAIPGEKEDKPASQNTPTAPQNKVTDVSDGRGDSYSSTVSARQEQQAGSRQQRPTLSRSNTKSRACLLM